ncbi:MAG: DUF1761 domain-containing protein [Flavobacteriales bacterium]|nr:DUF1761 domain-containing protein [Flavobacteriales bacterium]
MSNLLVLLAAAIIPTVIGFIWYNPKVFGNAWMKAADMSEEKMKGANMAVIFGVSLLLSFLLAFSMAPIVIHQFGVMGMLESAMRPESPTMAEATTLFNSLMETYGSNHRHFGHGALHGAMTALLLVLPIMGTNALFERKSFKYIAINAGYWAVTLAIMGGIVCQFFKFPM